MQNGERLSLEQIQAFLEASEEIQFEATNRQELYEWITRALCEQAYWKQGRAVKGMLRRYIGKMGLSRAQVTRLIGRYQEGGSGAGAKLQPEPVFKSLYSRRYRAAGGGG